MRKNQRLKTPKLWGFAFAVEKPIVNKTKQFPTYKSNKTNKNKTKPKSKLKTLKTTKPIINQI